MKRGGPQKASAAADCGLGMFASMGRRLGLRALGATRALGAACRGAGAPLTFRGAPLVAGACAVAFAGSTAGCDAKLPLEGVPGTKQERTLILVKPDGVERCVVGAVISKFETKGYKLVGLKMVWPSKSMAEDKYAGLRGQALFPRPRGVLLLGPYCLYVGGQGCHEDREMLDEVPGQFAADRGRAATALTPRGGRQGRTGALLQSARAV